MKTSARIDKMETDIYVLTTGKTPVGVTPHKLPWTLDEYEVIVPEDNCKEVSTIPTFGESECNIKSNTTWAESRENTSRHVMHMQKNIDVAAQQEPSNKLQAGCMKSHFIEPCTMVYIKVKNNRTDTLETYDDIDDDTGLWANAKKFARRQFDVNYKGMIEQFCNKIRLENAKLNKRHKILADSQ